MWITEYLLSRPGGGIGPGYGLTSVFVTHSVTFRLHHCRHCRDVDEDRRRLCLILLVY